MSINVKHWRFRVEPLEGKDVLSVLLDGLKYIDGKHWLSAGTLLGLERDGGFIPHDTDIDIAVIGPEEIKMGEDYEPIRFVTKDDKPMQRAYIHKPSNIIFDIFHYYEKEDKIYNTQEQGSIYRSKHLIEPLSIKSYLGHKFSVPNDVNAYLTEWYGDWRTPVRNGKTEWVR